MHADVWTSREGVDLLGDEIVGFDVEAREGTLGKVDHVTYEKTCVVITTSRLFGKRYVVPASSVEQVDLDTQTVLVDLSKEEVENSPEYDAKLGFNDDCESQTGAYYADVLSKRASAP